MNNSFYKNLPSSWALVSLEEITNIAYGKALPSYERVTSGNIPVYGSSGIVATHNKTLHSGPSIIIGRKGAVGSIYYTPGPFWCIDTAFFLENTHPVVDLEFLAFLLDSLNLSRFSITVAVPGISRRDLTNILIPLPPLSEQRRIAAILRQANELRQLRRQADERARDLIPALFYEMFGVGEPLEHPRNGWHNSTIGHITANDQYGTSISLNDDGNVAVVRMNNISVDGWLDLTDLKYLPTEQVDQDMYDLKPGDILFNRTNSRELVGKTGIWEETDAKYIFASYIIRLRTITDISPEYLWGLLNSAYGKNQLLRRAKQAVNMANINTKELASIPIVIPPKSLQEEFAKAVTTFSEQRKYYKEASIELDNLFQSLLNRSFKGELTESWRETHYNQLHEEAIQRDIALGLRTTEPTIGDLQVGRVTQAEQAQANAQLAQIFEQLQSVQSSGFQDFIAKIFGDISKIDINSLLASNTQDIQAMQVDMQEILSTQMAPVSALLAKQLLGVTQEFQALYSEMVKRAAFHPSPDLSKQFIELFSNLVQIGSASQLLSSRKALQDSLSEEVSDFINRIADAPVYFRSNDLVNGNINLLQVEDHLRLLKALGIVREVKIRGQICYRLVSNERDYAVPEGLDP